MRKLLAACLLAVAALVWSATAQAADLLYISEYTAAANQRGLIVQVAQESSHDQVTADFTSGAQQSAAFQNTTNLVRLWCSVQCSVAFGTNPTATNANKPLAAGMPEYFAVPAGAGFKVSVTTNP